MGFSFFSLTHDENLGVSFAARLSPPQVSSLSCFAFVEKVIGSHQAGFFNGLIYGKAPYLPER
jgi:hypothetical protein